MGLLKDESAISLSFVLCCWEGMIPCGAIEFDCERPFFGTFQFHLSEPVASLVVISTACEASVKDKAPKQAPKNAPNDGTNEGH